MGVEGDGRVGKGGEELEKVVVLVEEKGVCVVVKDSCVCGKRELVERVGSEVKMVGVFSGEDGFGGDGDGGE